MEVTHATFTMERTYAAPVSAVFSAWARPEARRRWFAQGAEHEQHFAVGGTECVRGSAENGEELAFEARYHDIVQNERIIYTSTLTAGDALSTVSATTVEFRSAAADGAEATRILLTEHGMYLPGQEQPTWRERGTADQLTALATELGVEVTEP
ncbi:uncharacterized protein YndB with AHSA1/START domain [Prauserella sediminis]|uniref:Uncharacterized protein YndB with AHSA1/START domain n=1 Tax=Prauserella sediminis TaxID=577680 RepID=A0A839XPS8_9PSEU|nr:SRPBCC domain-containing protein [Prauserella sediminis]MBB3662683.1 uncharacterized protein YndB with AHSA1/START domain [Prauserella sediminis]